MLLHETDVRLILAGRDAGRAREAAQRINEKTPEGRVDGTGVDAADPSSLDAAFRRCDLAVACVPLARIGRRVIRTACAAGVDYVGIYADAESAAVIGELSQSAERAGVCVVTEAGITPGAPAAMARWVAGRFDSVEDLTIGVLMRDRELAYGSAVDVMAATATQPSIYEDGNWRQPSLTATRTIDFGQPFGACACYPARMPEVEALPGALGLRRCGFYASGGNGLTTALAGFWYLLGLGKWEYGAQLGASLLVRAQRFSHPPYGLAVAVEALGEQGGRRQGVRVTLRQSDGYVATAIATVSLLFQLLDGTAREPGVRMMAHAVDADRFIADIGRLGMKPEENLIPA
jgi:saccharopine dehydrogenase (NAD+, L-lysine-forming)